ncbi:MAG: HAD-IIB family hydrolase [Erysipelotrichaceae bacterium]
MKIKAVFFDVDGTLLDSSNHKMPPSTLQALKLLKAKGIKLGIATGRSYEMLFDHELYLNLFDGMSIYNTNGKIILQHCLDPFCINKLIEEANKEHISISLETVNSVYNINQHNNYIKKAFKYFKAPLPPIHSYNNEPIIMAVGYNYLGYDWQSFGSTSIN